LEKKRVDFPMLGKSLCFGLMGLATVHPLVGLAERAHMVLDVLDHPETETALGLPRVAAENAPHAGFGHLPIVVRNFTHGASVRFFGCESIHISPISAVQCAG
jgi:hypothetical protein